MEKKRICIRETNDYPFVVSQLKVISKEKKVSFSRICLQALFEFIENNKNKKK